MESNPAASSGEAVATDTTPEWVVFSCDDQHFGIPLLLTREVVLPQALTRLPGCGAEVGGLMGLRGRVITVFDLGVVLGRGRVLQRPDHRILVVDHNERVAGLAVDHVAEIARNEAALLSAPPESMTESTRDVVGVGMLNGKPYLALDPNSILSRLLV